MNEVSAVITTYKREPEIVLRAIKSIQAQTYPVKEIIVVDDNENESIHSRELKAAICGQDKVRYIKQDGNKGACAARNLGMEKATGNFVAYLDDDDEWYPQKIEKQIAAFDADTGLVYCAGQIRDENYDPPKNSDYYNNKTISDNVTYDDLLYKDMIGSTSNPLIRRSVIMGCGGFDTLMPARQDYEMWIRISRVSKIKGIAEPLFLHYIHKGEQISKSSKKSLSAFKRIYQKNKKEYKKNKKARKMIFTMISSAARNNEKLVWLVYKIRAKLI